MTSEVYYSLDEKSKEVLVSWFNMTSEVLAVFKAQGYTDAEALKQIRKALTTKNIKYL